RAGTSSELELHRHFDDDVDGGAEPARGGEAPLPHRLRGAIVEAAAEPLQDAHVADRTVTAHDDLEHDVSGDPALARVLGVIRLHFAQQPWRLDAAAGTVRSAAGAASRAWTDPAAF